MGPYRINQEVINNNSSVDHMVNIGGVEYLALAHLTTLVTVTYLSRDLNIPMYAASGQTGTCQGMQTQIIVNNNDPAVEAYTIIYDIPKDLPVTNNPPDVADKSWIKIAAPVSVVIIGISGFLGYKKYVSVRDLKALRTNIEAAKLEIANNKKLIEAKNAANDELPIDELPINEPILNNNNPAINRDSLESTESDGLQEINLDSDNEEDIIGNLSESTIRKQAEIQNAALRKSKFVNNDNPMFKKHSSLNPDSRNVKFNSNVKRGLNNNGNVVDSNGNLITDNSVYLDGKGVYLTDKNRLINSDGYYVDEQGLITDEANRFLSKCNGQDKDLGLDYIDKGGRIVNGKGQLLDKKGLPVNGKGQYIDDSGEVINEGIGSLGVNGKFSGNGYSDDLYDYDYISLADDAKLATSSFPTQKNLGIYGRKDGKIEIELANNQKLAVNDLKNQAKNLSGQKRIMEDQAKKRLADSNLELEQKIKIKRDLEEKIADIKDRQAHIRRNMEDLKNLPNKLKEDNAKLTAESQKGAEEQLARTEARNERNKIVSDAKLKDEEALNARFKKIAKSRDNPDVDEQNRVIADSKNLNDDIEMYQKHMELVPMARKTAKDNAPFKDIDPALRTADQEAANKAYLDDLSFTRSVDTEYIIKGREVFNARILKQQDNELLNNIAKEKSQLKFEANQGFLKQSGPSWEQTKAMNAARKKVADSKKLELQNSEDAIKDKAFANSQANKDVEAFYKKSMAESKNNLSDNTSYGSDLGDETENFYDMLGENDVENFDLMLNVLNGDTRRNAFEKLMQDVNQGGRPNLDYYRNLNNQLEGFSQNVDKSINKSMSEINNDAQLTSRPTFVNNNGSVQQEPISMVEQQPTDIIDLKNTNVGQSSVESGGTVHSVNNNRIEASERENPEGFGKEVDESVSNDIAGGEIELTGAGKFKKGLEEDIEEGGI